MHPRNPFKKDYDFDELIKYEIDLEKFVFINKFGNQTIPFSNKQAVKALNSALLNFHYDIEWDIPKYNLCPPIPGRIDYLLHISDLVNKEDVKLLDIGTGANLIYPILGTCHFKWDCTASEIEYGSLKNAQLIIDNNDALKGIELRKQTVQNNILVNIIEPNDQFDVVVCNPPFFKNEMDAYDKNQRKVKNLKLKEDETLNFGGLSNELWYKGGEEAFVIKMAIESVKFKSQVKWFTSLVSQKYNLKPILRVLNKIEPTEIKVVEMELGNKRSRFVAWRFN